MLLSHLLGFLSKLDLHHLHDALLELPSVFVVKTVLLAFKAFLLECFELLQFLFNPLENTLFWGI